MVATDLAEALARAGTPFHQAHQLVGRLVLESVREGKRPADWSAEALETLLRNSHRRLRGCSIRAKVCNRAKFPAARVREPWRRRSSRRVYG